MTERAAPQPPQVAIAVMGVPGAGKTTLTASLRECLDADVFAAGDFLRRRAEDGDRAAESLLRSGKPLDTASHQDLVVAALCVAARKRKALLLDGSPRVLVQAEALAAVPWVIAGIALEISEHLAYERLMARALSGARRVDDSRESSRRRIRREVRCVEPVWQYFERVGWPLARLDATMAEATLVDAASSFLREEVLPLIRGSTD